MTPTIDLNISWCRGDDIGPEILEECSNLYSNHYGVWSAQVPPPLRPGKRISLSQNKLRDFLSTKDSWAALARYNDKLIGYAFALRGTVQSSKSITWITQLVVHEDYRHKDVAKRLLNSLWGFTDQYAWGLVTANPFAVRALEKATRRRCEHSVIEQYKDEIYQFGASRIGYINGKQLIVNTIESIINTGYRSK
jgi:GNAT superfamily N-acetyltransferase